jgi:hypothetical protein
VIAMSMTPLRRQQAIGIAGAIPAFIAIACAFVHANDWFGTTALPAPDIASRLAFAVRWMTVPGLCLLLGIWVAARRGAFGMVLTVLPTAAAYAWLLGHTWRP